MSSDITYDPSPILQTLLPSFYRSFVDGDTQQVLNAFYSGILRVADADYALLFTADASKSLETLTPFTFQPLSYQLLDDWKSNKVHHAHEHYQFPIPEINVGNEYQIRVPNVYLDGENVVYFGGAALPPHLYVTTYGIWLADDQLQRGTLITIDAERLHSFFNGDPQNSTYGGYNNGNQWYNNPINGGTGINGDDDDFDSLLSETDYVSVWANRVSPISTVVSNGSTTSFAVASDIDVFDTDVFLDSVNITAATSAARVGTKIQITVPSTIRGKQILVTLGADGTDNYLFTVGVDALVIEDTSFTKTIQAITLFLDVNIDSTVTISGNTLVINDQPLVFGKAKVRDNGVVQTSDIAKPTSAFNFGCEFSDQAELLYFGASLGQVERVLTAPETECNQPDVTKGIKLGHAPDSGVILRFVGPKEVEHTHLSHRETILTGATTVTLAVQDADFYPFQLFFNGKLQSEFDFTYSGGVFTFDAVTVDTVVDVHYLSTAAVKHKHYVDWFVEQSDTAETSTISLDHTILDVLQVFDNGQLQGDSSLYTTNGGFINFTTPLAPHSPYVTHTIASERKYWHDVPDKVEADWNYRGRLVSAECLQDGINKPTTQLTSSDFELTTVNNVVRVATDSIFTNGWWVNANWDEHTIENVWGESVNIIRDSSDRYARLMAAIYVGMRSASLVDSLENFCSIILGSNYVSQAGRAAGINFDGTNQVLTIDPIDPTQDNYTLTLSDCFPTRDLTKPCLPRFYAVNKLVDVFDTETLSQIRWLPFFAEDVSTDYRVADRLDNWKLNILVSVPASFDRETGILKDYSVNFQDLEIYTNDLIRADLGVENADGGFDLGAEFVYGRILEIRDAHTLVLNITLPEGVGSGFGEDGYGEGSFGGTLGAAATIGRYHVYARKTESLDTGRFLDKSEANLVTQVAEVLQHHTAAIKIDWAAMTNTETIDDLGTYLDKVTPASAKQFVYTEAYKSECHTRLNDLIVALAEDGLPTTTGITNCLVVGESHFLLETQETSVVGDIDVYDQLCANYGPHLTALACEPNPDQVVGQYYLTTEKARLLGSVWDDVYSFERGLENLVLKVTPTGYEASSNIGARTADGLNLVDSAKIIVNSTSSISSTKSNPTLLDYTVNDPIMVHTTVYPNVVRTTTERPRIFEWGQFILELVPNAVGGFAVQLYSYDTVTPLTSADGVVATFKAAHIAFTYQLDDTNTYGVATIYVDGNLVAQSTETDPVITVVPAIPAATQAIIGGATVTDPTKALKARLESFGLSMKQKWAESDILELQAARLDQLAPLGLANGQPLSRGDHTLMYQWHTSYPYPIIPDYTGNAYNAEIIGTGTRAEGTLLTTWSRTNDRHFVKKYYVDENCERQAVPGSELDDIETGTTTSGGVLAPDGHTYPEDTLLTFGNTLIEADASQKPAQLIMEKQTAGSWEQILPLACPYASVSSDDSDWYLLFV